MYASDEMMILSLRHSCSFYCIVNWEIIATGLGTINVIYRKDNSLKYFTSLQEILHLVTREDLMTKYGCVVTYYQDKEADGVGLILWTRSIPSRIKLTLKNAMDYSQLDNWSGSMGNELTTAVQLVKFLKKQIADSKRAAVA
ncbi:hypothetical protein Tco_0079044 [Tanacetum coccineum]